jgi:hypothetical protein
MWMWNVLKWTIEELRSPWPSFNGLKDHKRANERKSRKQKQKKWKKLPPSIQIFLRSFEVLLRKAILICLLVPLHASDLWFGTWDCLTNIQPAKGKKSKSNDNDNNNKNKLSRRQSQSGSLTNSLKKMSRTYTEILFSVYFI